MGIVINLMLLFTEAALIIYCIKTEQNQNKLRSQIRITAWLLFVGGILSSIIEWSFRWYLLFGLLSVMAVICGVRLWTKTFGTRPYKRVHIFLKGIAAILMFVFAVLPGIIFPQYELPATTGDLKVQTETYTFTDLSRVETFSETGEHRKLNVQIWYPERTDESCPLVVFSHGAFGVKMSNTSTFTELASHGYVVCAIDHPYHAAGTVDETGELTIGSKMFMQEVLDINKDIYSEQEEYALYSKWMTLRTEDMKFVLDQLLESPENTSAKIYRLIDPDKIGLMGHSLGGAASAQLGRDRDDIRAVINLDGTMLGEYCLSAAGVPEIRDVPYPLPLLNFYSDYVLKELEANPDYVYVNQHLSKLSPMAFETHIQGSNHMSYTDLPLFSPLLANQLSGISGGSAEAKVDATYAIETMNMLVLEFFNCYLKDIGKFDVKESY